MAERWVEFTRKDDGKRVWINMANVNYVVRQPFTGEAPFKGEDVTHLFPAGSPIELAVEPPEHFISKAGAVIYQAKELPGEIPLSTVPLTDDYHRAKDSLGRAIENAA